MSVRLPAARGLHRAFGQFAAPDLRLDPTWDWIRDHPRFQKLVGR